MALSFEDEIKGFLWHGFEQQEVVQKAMTEGRFDLSQQEGFTFLGRCWSIRRTRSFGSQPKWTTSVPPSAAPSCKPRPFSSQTSVRALSAGTRLIIPIPLQQEARPHSRLGARR
jgi:hypothetical protein